MSRKKFKRNDVEIWTEEQTDQYLKGLYDLDFIVGYTESGVPYGVPLDVDYKENSFDGDGEELPFD